jgi:hypothetical protein
VFQSVLTCHAAQGAALLRPTLFEKIRDGTFSFHQTHISCVIESAPTTPRQLPAMKHCADLVVHMAQITGNHMRFSRDIIVPLREVVVVKDTEDAVASESFTKYGLPLIRTNGDRPLIHEKDKVCPKWVSMGDILQQRSSRSQDNAWKPVLSGEVSKEVQKLTASVERILTFNDRPYAGLPGLSVAAIIQAIMSEEHHSPVTGAIDLLCVLAKRIIELPEITGKAGDIRKTDARKIFSTIAKVILVGTDESAAADADRFLVFSALKKEMDGFPREERKARIGGVDLLMEIAKMFQSDQTKADASAALTAAHLGLNGYYTQRSACNAVSRMIGTIKNNDIKFYAILSVINVIMEELTSRGESSLKITNSIALHIIQGLTRNAEDIEEEKHMKKSIMLALDTLKAKMTEYQPKLS